MINNISNPQNHRNSGYISKTLAPLHHHIRKIKIIKEFIRLLEIFRGANCGATVVHSGASVVQVQVVQNTCTIEFNKLNQSVKASGARVQVFLLPYKKTTRNEVKNEHRQD